MSAPDAWSITESSFDIAMNRHYESVFTLGSGLLHQRASLEEGLTRDPQDIEYLAVPGQPPGLRGQRKSCAGTFLAGVRGPHPVCGEELINLPSLHGLMIYTAGERLDMEKARVQAYTRSLDLRTGHLIRSFVWTTAAGATLGVRFERFISARRKHVMVLRCTIAHLAGRAAELRFIGSLDANVRTNGFDHFETVEITGEHEPVTLAVRTNSGIEVAAAALLTSDRGLAWTVQVQPRWVACCGSYTLDPGQSLRVDKFASLTSSRHVGRSPLDVARKLAWDAASTGFDRLAAESDAVWRERWDHCDVQIEQDAVSQRALRVAMYHLLRAGAEDAATLTPFAASSAADFGRLTWHADIYAMPFYLYTRPSWGRQLARARVDMLDGARANASRGGYRGARFAYACDAAGHVLPYRRAWEALAAHTTAGVAHGVFHAHMVNPQDPALLRGAAALLVEAARYCRDRAAPSAPGGVCEVLGVVGPDAYAPFARNNAYTNRMFAFTLAASCMAWDRLARIDPSGEASLRRELRLDDAELAAFARVAASLRLPYDERRELILASDDFFRLETVDVARWQGSAAAHDDPFQLERLYRAQVMQQADPLLLIALFRHEFSDAQMRAAYEAYTPLTLHHAPTSRPMHAIAAAWIGRDEEAFELWRTSLDEMLLPRSAADGFDLRRAAAVWQAAVMGFGGVWTRLQSEALRVEPHLPVRWQRMAFPLVWDQQPVYVTIEPPDVHVEHRGRLPLRIAAGGEIAEMNPGDRATLPCASSAARR